VRSLSVSEQRVPQTERRTAVKVEGLHVTYRRPVEKKPTFKSTVKRVGRRQRVVKEIEALKGVTFDVPQGVTLGVVGHNGAGKSTLMRAIGGILPPTEGRIEVNGKVSTLLALGVGFNKKLSGRDNVFLGGLAAGFSKDEMAQRYDEIVKFAGLADFMDMPMRTYSSGMQGRLAFSVAVNMDPDILLIDEALSVGDARFRKRSSRKMRQLCKGGHTVILVSHALGTIKQLCDMAIWLDQGELKMWDESDKVVDAYTEYLEVDQDALSLEDV
jgi:ABC-type polysaccharide/polyol phosphate transport system ATPase subunit